MAKPPFASWLSRRRLAALGRAFKVGRHRHRARHRTREHTAPGREIWIADALMLESLLASDPL